MGAEMIEAPWQNVQLLPTGSGAQLQLTSAGRRPDRPRWSSLVLLRPTQERRFVEHIIQGGGLLGFDGMKHFMGIFVDPLIWQKNTLFVEL